jgi:long-chain acyl-CoA synthetase
MARSFEDFPNLVSMFFTRARQHGDRPFLWNKTENGWQSISWAETASRVAALAEALAGLGLSAGDRVALVSENRPEWCIADLAIMAAGCVTVPTYTTNTERDHLHILENACAKAVFVSTPKLARALLPAVFQSSECRTVIGFEPLRSGQQSDVRLYDLKTLVADCPGNVEEAEHKASTLKRDDLACIIYTSGTGGAPRGVCQHHGGILHNVAGCFDIIANDFPNSTETFLSFLPLSHAYEHSGGQFFPIGIGGEIYYAEGLEKLASNIEEVRPSIMIVVPRLFEVLRARMVKAVEKQGKAAQWMLDQALRLGRVRYERGSLPLYERPLNLLLERAFRPRIRQRFGGRIKAMVSGGAPLNADVGIFFQSIGLTLLQGYGQTEASPVISCNRPAAGIRMDTVGPPLKGVEMRIAEDGEILVRGELVMHGYWRNEQETARVLKDGWLHTGDVGHIDGQGRLVITDRKKDIIVNDKGDNVAPQRVEGMLTLQPEIFQAMVHGDRRPYLVGLIVPDPEWAKGWALTQGLEDEGDLSANPAFQRAVMAAVDKVNANLSVIERVRRVVIADAPFTVENEQLTPSMKIRRHVLRGVYGPRLEALYRA